MKKEELFLCDFCGRDIKKTYYRIKEFFIICEKCIKKKMMRQENEKKKKHK